MTVNVRSQPEEWLATWAALLPRPRYCACGHDRAKRSRMQRLPQRNAALVGVGVQQSITENA